MEEQSVPSPANVADAFVSQYFIILDKSPENLHKFYLEPSLLGWPGIDGDVTPVTTLKAIHEKVMSSDYKDCSVEVKTTDAQKSLDGGIIVAVTGCLTGKDDVKKNFSQTFFLAKQEKGYFVLNDILRIFDVCTSETDCITSDKDDQRAPTVSCDASNCPAPLDFKAAIQVGKAEEESYPPISEGNLANGVASRPSIPSGTEIAKWPAVAPTANAKVPSAVTPAANVPKKSSYASVLVKMIAASDVTKQTMGSPTPKPSSPRGDVSPKASTPSRGVAISKTSTYSSNVMPKSPTGGEQGANAFLEAKGIYIGGLPFGITKQGIVDVVKQFGEVRKHSETIQIRRHEDGFCCGFVEFESADSARRAVEAHRVMFGDKEAYVTYKRAPYNRGNNSSRARSPTGELRNSSSRGRENDGWGYYNSKGGGRGAHRSTSSDQWPRPGSRDRAQ